MVHTVLKAMKRESIQSSQLISLEQDLNPQSPAYQAGTLPTEPPRQLIRLGSKQRVETKQTTKPVIHCTCTHVYTLVHNTRTCTDLCTCTL